MSVTIRLARIGRKKLPAYKIVANETRDKRNGRFLEIIGHYNPSMNPVQFAYDKEKYEKWLKRGALVTEAVIKLIEGKYEYKPYTSKTRAAAAESSSDTSTSLPAEALAKEGSVSEEKPSSTGEALTDEPQK